MCVDLTWPTLRFVANQTGEKDAELKVEVLYPEAEEKHATWHGAKKFKPKRKDGWSLTEDVKLSPDRGGKFAGGRPVALRFTNTSDHGSWQIDNVYVDPRCSLGRSSKLAASSSAWCRGGWQAAIVAAEQDRPKLRIVDSR